MRENLKERSFHSVSQISGIPIHLASATVTPGASTGPEAGLENMASPQAQSGRKLLSLSLLNTVRLADIFRSDFHLKTAGE